MYHALRDAIIAEVRKHEAEGDCPTARSYGIEMLENVILDLAFASPTPEPSGAVVEALYQYASDLRFPPTGDSITRRLESVEALIAKISGEK